MLRSLREPEGYHVEASDGSKGKVKDFLFDDRTWTIRYLVVDTGSWLAGRQVLIASASLLPPDWTNRSFPVTLSKKQIDDGPSIDAHMPVSRAKEREILRYYNVTPYWQQAGYPFVAGETATAPPVSAAPAGDEPAGAVPEPHLRSFNEVRGYRLDASDGDAGAIDDAVIDDENWAIRYVVVKARVAGRPAVLMSPQWMKEIDWSGTRVLTGLTREQIGNAPRFDPAEPVNRRYEERLYDYYGRPTYWT